MFTPEGLNADKIDKIMLLAMWTRQRAREVVSKAIISAGMGKPTFPIDSHTVKAFLQYWTDISTALKKALDEAAAEGKAFDEATAGKAIDYGNPSGDESPSTRMAKALTKWYGVKLSPEELLFTVGGAGALRVIFESFNELNQNIPHYRVITPFPHYTLYSDNRHKLHPIDVMSQEGYRLTKTALEKSIKEAYQLAKTDGNAPKMILLSNPSNPLGTILTEQELADMADVLRQYPDLHVVIDEAYAEMNWRDAQPPSIYRIAPDLKDRVTIIRSATKGHSAAGERMAVMMSFNEQLRNTCLSKNIGMVGHAPRSSQYAYAEAMHAFDESTSKKIKEFYQPKLGYVSKRLKEMVASMPDSSYEPEGTFYVMADLSDLFGINIPKEAERALGYGGTVKTSEELIYSLLFSENIMLAPGQYFGLSPNLGYCRITCSGKSEELDDLMDRLDSVLWTARMEKRETLLTEIDTNLDSLRQLSEDAYTKFMTKRDTFCEPIDQQELVSQVKKLKELSSDIRVMIMRNKPNGEEEATRTLQSFFRKALSDKNQASSEASEEKAWRDFVHGYATEGGLRNYLLNMPKKERVSFVPWAEKKEQLFSQDDSSTRKLR
ncbi:MAG: pyridoxal phosphate-dependent aminotransferase [Legionellaceae bacterium]|nr:pyridoxal phosphate-dependent aminotransferase [Legionellaceae bacterium]